MSILFIIAGVILAIVGVVGLTKNSGNTETTQEFTAPKDRNNSVDNSPSASGQPADSVNPSSIDPVKQRGNEFEGYMVDVFAPEKGFLLKEWNQGQISPNGNFSEDELKPDLKIERVRPGKNLAFWLECKYRSTLNSKYPLFKDYQIERYSTFQGKSHIKVLVAIGTGGTPSAPEKVYILPLDTVKVGTLTSESDYSPFELKDPANGAAKYIDDYFKTIFSKSRK